MGTRVRTTIKLAFRRFYHAAVLTRNSFAGFLRDGRDRGSSVLRGLANADVCSRVNTRVCTTAGREQARCRGRGQGLRNVRVLTRRRIATVGRTVTARGTKIGRTGRRGAATLTGQS